MAHTDPPLFYDFVRKPREDERGGQQRGM
jgi:hypothetical protein